MLRLTVNPDTLFFTNKWCVYVHLQSVSSTFNMSFLKIAEIHTVADFWRVFNNIPSCEDLHTNTVMLEGKKIIAYSLFKEDITPEWEHPVNFAGCEWGCREEMTASLFSFLYSRLALSAVNSEIDHVVGIRCINKCNKLRNIHKIEVWMECNDMDSANIVKSFIDDVKKQHTDGNYAFFTLLYHEDKQSKAFEYSNNKKKNHRKRIKFN